jgi:hypothetical protein
VSKSLSPKVESGKHLVADESAIDIGTNRKDRGLDLVLGTTYNEDEDEQS